jgi:hypothetical protein
VCVYTVGEFYTFLPKLEVVINKVQVTNKWWILWGDWNINLLQYSKKIITFARLTFEI